MKKEIGKLYIFKNESTEIVFLCTKVIEESIFFYGVVVKSTSPNFKVGEYCENCNWNFVEEYKSGIYLNNDTDYNK